MNSHQEQQTLRTVIKTVTYKSFPTDCYLYRGLQMNRTCRNSKLIERGVFRELSYVVIETENSQIHPISQSPRVSGVMVGYWLRPAV